ncbi:DinB family protein [Algoriphagus persicinus]|uniref:DinB family protein n=1 Tax=Algoriphagus persicinus TaxID=3108754 RepID=UPI002B3E3893|nr:MULTISPECIES: DinB family protein [unclassified Algoriphagus]MEB2779459.1 DinB family protein [Algoriphagus sp. C2-6-M1]MEB2783579.1 DinB family protein [Algoriphagus sp. E1-3-M2]
MKKVLQFLSGSILVAIFMLASTAVSAQTTKDEFLSKWQNSKQFTLDVLDKMPDSGMDYKTDPAAMSFKEQIHHVGNAIVGISQGFLKGGDPGFTIDVATASKADLAAYVGKCYDYGTATMKALSDADAGESIEVFGNNVSRRQVMALLMDHSTHHRGAAIAYLRAEGVEPPAFVGF